MVKHILALQTRSHDNDKKRVKTIVLTSDTIKSMESNENIFRKIGLQHQTLARRVIPETEGLRTKAVSSVERATSMCDPESLVSRIHDGHETVIAILPPFPKSLRCSVVPLLRKNRVDNDMPGFVLNDGLPCLSNGLHDLLPIPSTSQDWLSWQKTGKGDTCCKT